MQCSDPSFDPGSGLGSFCFENVWLTRQSPFSANQSMNGLPRATCWRRNELDNLAGVPELFEYAVYLPDDVGSLHGSRSNGARSSISYIRPRNWPHQSDHSTLATVTDPGLRPSRISTTKQERALQQERVKLKPPHLFREWGEVGNA